MLRSDHTGTIAQATVLWELVLVTLFYRAAILFLFYRNFLSALFYRAPFWLRRQFLAGSSGCTFSLGFMLAECWQPHTGSFYRASRYFVLWGFMRALFLVHATTHWYVSAASGPSVHWAFGPCG